VVVGIAYAKTVHWSRGVFNAEAAGYLIGNLLTPLLVAAFVVWLINRARREKLSPAQKHLFVVLLVLFMSLVSFAGSMRDGGRSSDASVKDQVGHLLKQATGKEVGVNANWYDGPTREFLRDLVSFSQEYTGAIHSVDKTPIAKLYTPESYATPARMQHTIAELQAMLEVDKKYESLDPVVKKLEANIDAAQASNRQKQEFLAGFHSSLAKTLAPRTETFRTEEEWLQSSIELYQFVLAHVSDYTVHEKKLIFRGDGLRLEFQDKQSKSIALRKTAVEAKSKFDASRQDAMSRGGISPSDLPFPQPAK